MRRSIRDLTPAEGSICTEHLRPRTSERYRALRTVLRHVLAAIALAAFIVTVDQISQHSVTPATVTVGPAAITIDPPTTTTVTATGVPPFLPR